MLGKIKFTGNIECLTGLMVGSSKDDTTIRGVDMPVLWNPIKNQPFISGSALKGKLRYLAELVFPVSKFKDFGSGDNKIKRHECDDSNEGNTCSVCSLFGSVGTKTEKSEGRSVASKLMFKDALFSCTIVDPTNQTKVIREYKAENALNRLDFSANPRTLERVPKGTNFKFEFIYTVSDNQVDRISKDVVNLTTVMRILEDSYIGGQGSRGSGKIKFSGIDVKYTKIGNGKTEKLGSNTLCDLKALQKFFSDTNEIINLINDMAN